MPCTDGGDDYKFEAQDEELERLQERCDKLARMLCRLCKRIERGYPHDSFGALIATDRELRTWWASHKKLDRKRRR
jgi:hypothetical protein